MSKRDLTLREIQLAELELLGYLDDFCQKNGIQYYLIGGTLLGAIRHEGFIPWDDDIDVCMPRPDYNRFLAMDMEENVPAHIRRVRGGDPGNGHAFSRIIDSRINVEAVYSDNVDRNIWIDIFPVDGVPDSRIKSMVLYKKVDILQKLQGLSHAKLGHGRTPFRKIAKRFVKPIARIGNGKYEICIEKIAQKYCFEDAQMVGVVNGALHGVREIMNKRDFMCPRRIFFEGRSFPIFSCSIEYLKNIYGDYMKFPPEKERRSHIMRAWFGGI